MWRQLRRRKPTVPAGDPSLPPTIPGTGGWQAWRDGGTSRLWRGVRDADGERVIAKTLLPDALSDRELIAGHHREAEALRATKGLPGVIPALGWYPSAYPHGSLLLPYRRLPNARHTVFAREQAERPAEWIRWAAMLRLVEALQGVHAAGWVHRDVKPENLLVDVDVANEGAVTLLDFALALPAGKRPGRPTGSPSYVAPEQIRGKRSDAAADAYAVGAMLFEIATGRLPYEGSRDEKLAAHQHAPVPSLPPRSSGGDAIGSITQGLLAKKPRLRPSLVAVAEVLRPLAVPPGG